MKLVACFTMLLLMTVTSFSQEKKNMNPEVTTYYFIRHAEKDRSNPSEQNPHLNEAGKQRADRWSSVLKNVKFDAVYSTDYHRTIETAQPIANSNNKSITKYDPGAINANVAGFVKDTKGKKVLVVGHSNTTPAFVNAILGQKKYQDMDDSDNGLLFIVTVIGDTMADQAIVIN